MRLKISLEKHKRLSKKRSTKTILQSRSKCWAPQNQIGKKDFRRERERVPIGAHAHKMTSTNCSSSVFLSRLTPQVTTTEAPLLRLPLVRTSGTEVRPKEAILVGLAFLLLAFSGERKGSLRPFYSDVHCRA